MKKVLLGLAVLILLSGNSFAATLSGATDNVVAINGNTAVTVTSNLSGATWIINTVSDAYLNVWGITATTSSRKLLANSVYEIRMDQNFSILGTATENIVILLKKSTDGRDILSRGLDSDLLTIASLSPGSDSFIVGNGTAWAAETPAQARSSLSLGDMALQSSNNVAITGGAINGVTIGATTVVQAQAYRPINAQTTVNYTLVLADAGKMVTLTNASSVTVNVPANSSVAFPVGTEIDLAQMGAGQVTIVAGGGVTISSMFSNLKIATQYAGATLKKLATDTWLLVGNLTS